MSLRTKDFDYHLPDELIAARPLERRAASRMLVVHRDSGKIEHRMFRDFPEFLRQDDLLVLNDTKVIPARVFSDDGRIEYTAKWNGGARAKVSRDADRWTVELAIPRSDIGVRLQPGATARILLCRNIVHTRPDGEHEQNACVFLDGSKFQTVEKFATLRFASTEAIERFTTATTAAANGEPAPARTPTQRRRALEKAEAELKAAGINSFTHKKTRSNK